jgi:uncharacterized protein YcaQ
VVAAPSSAPRRLSLPRARRIALAAQGFADPRPTGRIDARHIRRVLDRIAVLQLDSVNVFCRSHYLPVLARLGPYPRDLLDRMSAHTATAGGRRELFEYWAHEASLLAIGLQPLLRWRMARVDTTAWGGMVRVARDFPHIVDETRQLVAARGPIRANATLVERAPRVPGEMWNWHDGKRALEYLFWAGEVTAARRVNFERHYDRTDRVLPAEVLSTPTPAVEDAQRELVRIAARALGVATEPDLGDYFRLPRAESKARVAELVAAAELEPVSVAGWAMPAYRWPGAREPRQVRARALLSPFDSLIWFRDRTQRLFDFRYRVEIYTPAAQREHGYYVLPFLLGEHLVARVDLKSDRQAGELLVQAAYLEPGQEPGCVAAELAAELQVTAEWLGLGGVRVAGRGDLGPALHSAVAGLRAG